MTRASWRMIFAGLVLAHAAGVVCTRPAGAAEIRFEATTLPKDEAEKKILNVLDDMDRSQRRGMLNVPVEDARLLRLLAESTGAEHVVEIGTSNGYSGIWFCLALRTTGGKLTTFEIDPGRAALARENFNLLASLHGSLDVQGTPGGRAS